MDRKKLVLLLGALVIAIGTALAARSMFAGAAAPQAEAAPPVPEGPRVLVAQRALPAGTIITADALGFQMWPEDLVQDAYFIDGEADISKLLGTVVRLPITAGEPVTQGSLVKPGDSGFLAAALGPGMRAVTVPVSAQTGVAGFVFPGDRVDLVLTQEVKGEGPSLRVSETIVRNVRVLATDQRIDSKGEDGKVVVEKFENVTLEATPRIAEKIAVAQSVGDLSLSLRSIADNTAELERAVASGEVKVPQGTSPADERRLLTAYASRPMDNNPTFTTGGHVSRFQRRTVPPQDSLKSEVGQASDALAKIANAVTAPPAPTGPVVRVARGNSVTVVPVGAR